MKTEMDFLRILAKELTDIEEHIEDMRGSISSVDTGTARIYDTVKYIRRLIEYREENRK